MKARRLPEKQMIKFVIPVLALLVLIVGCQPQDAAAPSDPNNVGNSATDNASSTSLVKCAECGKEVDASMIVAHGDQKICKDCEAKHGH